MLHFMRALCIIVVVVRGAVSPCVRVLVIYMVYVAYTNKYVLNAYEIRLRARRDSARDLRASVCSIESRARAHASHA